ncbi:MFS transporter [Xylocopilactobacillus apis]|uniref:Multidrug resistance protein n=1 Tax=Xylocopilactobacillus apis TaxID=2932183 RepID=A0AAU9CS18_9LACO|nr:MFS transporter [Xylocopilactobacillus apis]BDR56744.1 multidrug resistance protein [Xylocopilactobacillus apis]
MEDDVQSKKNLFFLTISVFMVSMSLSEVTPFLSLYISSFGKFSKGALGFYSAVAYAATFFAMAISAPFWGKLADRSGRRLMLIRASLGLFIAFTLMGFVTNVWEMIILRLFQGFFGGYVSNANALIAANTPKKHVGRALGTIVTGSTSGSFLGPLLGGVFASIFSLRHTFFVTGFGLFLVFLVTIIFIKEDFHPQKKESMPSGKEFFAKLANRNLVIGLFITTMIIQMVNLSINPIVSLYVKELMNNKGQIALMAGVVSAAPGISTALTAPIFGRLGDRLGAEKMLIAGFVFAFFVQLGTSMIASIGLLVLMRFLIGISDAALLPSVNSLLTRNTDQAQISRVFAYNQSFMSLGAMVGPLLGSLVAGVFDYRGIFVAGSLLVLVNLLINVFTQKKIIKP